MATIRLLNVRRLWEQPFRALLAIVAIAAGTTLLVGVLIDQASLSRSFDSFIQQRAGFAQLEVGGPGGPAGLDESVLAKVRAVDGVGTAAPIVQVVTIAEDAAGTERFVVGLGVDCSIQGVVGDFGCDGELLSLQNAYATSNTLVAGLGEGGVVRTDLDRLPILNAFPVDQLDDFNDGNVVVFSLKEAQRQFGFDHALTSILVVPERGRSVDALNADLEKVVGPQNHVGAPGTIGGTDFASMFIAMLMILSLFGLAIGAQLVHNTVALTLEERRRDLAVVGAVGASRRLLLAGTLIEAGVLGVAGGLLGVVGGILVAHPLVDGMSDTLDEITGLRLSVHVTPFAIGAGVVLGIVTSVFAAIGPARRASRMDVAAELHGQARRDETTSAARGKRAAVYVVLAGVGLFLAWLGHRDGAIEKWQPMAAYVGMGLTMLLSFRAAQHGAAPLLALAQRAPFLRDGAARLAMGNLAGEPKRTGVMIMALAAAVGTGVVLGNINGSIVDGSREASMKVGGDSVYVSTLPANNSLGIEAKLSPRSLERLRAVDGVASVTGERGFCGEYRSIGRFCSTLNYGDRDNFTIYRGRTSVHDVFAHDEVLIGTSMARVNDLRPGDTFELPGRFGVRTVKVGAIWGDPNNTGMGITLPRDVFESMYGNHPSGGQRVTPEAGVSVDELDRRIEAANIDPDLKSFGPEELATDFANSIKTFVAPFNALQRAMLIVALVAITSTLLLVGVQRRREHGLLMAVGMAPSGLGKMVLLEAGFVGIAASILGTIAGVVSYVAMMWVSPLFTGLSAPFHFDLTAPAVYGGIGLVFVLLGAALPAWRTSRVDPAIALRYE